MNTRKTTRFSTAFKKGVGFFRATALAGTCFFAMLSGKAHAQIFTDGFEGVTVSGSTANAGGATGNANLGIALSNWSTTGSFTTFTGTAPTTPTALSLSNSSATTQTWTLTIPVSGCYEADMTGMSFDYRATNTSYTSMLVKVNGTAVDVVSLNTNSAFHNVAVPTFSVAATGSVTVTFTLSGGTHGSGGTFRLDNVNILGAVNLSGSACTGSPANGTALPASTTVCAGIGSNVALNLSGATVGCGITYQWYSSPDGITYAPISGATNSNYNTPVVSNTITTTTNAYYECMTTCTNSSVTVTSSVATVTANPLPAISAITNLAHPLLVGSSQTLGNTPGGFWSTTPTSVATIDPVTGVINGVTGGVVDVNYQIIDPVTGCTSSVDSNENVLWPNTLALYTGTNGSNTNVINVPGETVGALTSVGFGTNGSCTTGGLSGLTVPTTFTGYNIPSASPYVYYKIKPEAGNALNVFRIAAKTRESSTGTQDARIAYSLNGGLTWIDENRDVAQTRGGSCGANSNSWDYGTPTGGLTINGITDSILVAVYPYASTNNSGTFQLNSLEVYGVVSSATACSGTPSPAGTVLPALSNICDSGSRFLSIDSSVFTGTAGPGITYQWDSSLDGTNYFPIAGATNITYQTPEFHAGVSAATIYYELVTTCTNSGLFAASSVATVTVNAIPAGFAITGMPANLIIGTPVTLGSTYTGTGTTYWSSNDTSVASVDSMAGLLSGHLPGYAGITFHVTENGCTGVVRDTVPVIEPHTLVAYLGKNGTSTDVNTYTTAVTVSSLTATGYGSATPCGSGGISGLTNNGVTTYDPTHANLSFTVTPVAGTFMSISGFHTTLRNSTSGIQSVRLVYSQDGGASWIDEGADQVVENDDCGYSHKDNYWLLANPNAPSLPVFTNNPVIFRLYGFNPAAANGTLQVNAVDITGEAAPLCTTHTISQINDSLGVDINGRNFCDYGTGAVYQFTPSPATADLSIWSSDNTPQLAFDSIGTYNGVSHIYPATGVPGVDITYVGWYNDETANGCLTGTTESINIVNCAHPPLKPTAVATVSVSDVQVYPNPAQMVLNVKSPASVNVSVMSMDGKTLIEQKDAKSINISKLASGVYMLKIFDMNNTLVKTEKFTKE